jgi:hypothetical protein
MTNRRMRKKVEVTLKGDLELI